MFRDVITGEPGVRADILRALVGAPKNVSEISDALGKKKNGHLTSALEELAEAGFIVADPGLNPETGRAAQAMRYRIKGLAFENLVVNNFRTLLPPLGLERSLVVSAAP